MLGTDEEYIFDNDSSHDGADACGTMDDVDDDADDSSGDSSNDADEASDSEADSDLLQVEADDSTSRGKMLEKGSISSTPRPLAPPMGELWSADQFPEGTRNHACWDWSNICAAQQWSCPCADRRNCIGEERLKPEALLIHRKEFQTSVAPFRGGLRDCTRQVLEEHYCKESQTFSRSFVVAGLNDCCAASKGLADGLAFVTWARARCDVRKARPYHAGRMTKRKELEHSARRQINAYLRNLRESMEGSKGGSRGSGKSYTGKQSKKARYEAYRKSRIDCKEPVLGSQKLFNKCWDAQEGIVELRRTGHQKCNECSEIETDRDTYEQRADAVAREKMREIEAREERHRNEHRGERNYADDFWEKAKCRPSKVTMMNMDAPTKDQLEIPVQPRMFRDAAKCLENAPRWACKMMGVMIAGVGMLCFLVHQRLGAGPNLTITCLYLSLLYMMDSGKEFGSRFMTLLDNTAAENKCNEMIFFMAWLVANDVFEDASFFCMMVGHTYTGLDQSFNTMNMHLQQFAIYTVSVLMNYIWRSLQKYECHKVEELHALWDWKAYFENNVTERIGGFCTGQYGSGMHEFYLRKDATGDVRLWLRKSSQASSWVPEGEGYKVFETVPTGQWSVLCRI